MALLFGLTGPPGCGKDAMAQRLVEAHQFHRVAFADEIREALLVLDPCVQGCDRLSEIVADHGWEQAKKRWPEVRRLLQVLGTELGRDLHGTDCWVDMVFTKVDALSPDDRVVLSDVRFPNEAEAVRSRGGTVIRINRGIRPPEVVMDHASERESAALKADHILPNLDSLDQFHGRIDRLVYRRLALRRTP